MQRTLPLKYLYRISDLIEDNILDPEQILSILQKEYFSTVAPEEKRELKSEQKESKSAVAHVDPTEDPETLPPPKKKRKLDYHIKPNTPLSSLLDFLESKATPRQQEDWINILSAYISYFPNTLEKLPKHIQQKLTIYDAGQLILEACDPNELKHNASFGRLQHLENIILRSADKGKEFAERLCVQLSSKEFYDSIRAMSQLPNVILGLPSQMQQDVIQLLMNCLATEYASGSAFALISLKDVIATLPDKGKSVREGLYEILLNSKLTWAWDEAAICLNVLTVELNWQHTKDICQKIIMKMKKYCKVTALGELDSILVPSKRTTLVLKSLNQAAASGDSYHKTNAIEALGKLVQSTMANTYWPSILVKLGTHIEKLGDFNRYRCPNHVDGIDKLAHLFERYPDIGHDFMVHLFDAAFKRKNIAIFPELLEQWQRFIIQRPDGGQSFIEPLMTAIEKGRLTDSGYFKFPSPLLFKVLAPAIKQLPDQGAKVIQSLMNLITTDRSFNRLDGDYAVESLSYLGEAIALQPDRGAAVIESIWKKHCSRHHIYESKAIVALLQLSSVLAELPNQARMIFNSLFERVNYMDRVNAFSLVTNLLNVLPEDRDRIIEFLNKIGTEYKLGYEYGKVASVHSDVICKLDGIINKSKATRIEGWSLSGSRDTYNRVTEDSTAIAKTSTTIANKVAYQHPKYLSWICVMRRRLEEFPQERYSILHSKLTCSLGNQYTLFNRRKMLSQHFPDPLVRVVEGYLEENAKEKELRKKLRM